jgi:hypothetical protein
LDGRAIPHLTVIVATPTHQKTISFQDTSVSFTGHNRAHIIETVHLNRDEPIGGGVITHLTDLVLTPTPHRAIGFQGTSVDTTSRDCCYATIKPVY